MSNMQQNPQPVPPFMPAPGQPAPGAPQAPVKEKKPWYKKWWVWAIVVVVVIAAIGGGSGASSNKSDGGTAAPASSAASASAAGSASATTESSAPSGEMDTEGDLTNAHVKIVSAVKSTADYQGKDTVLVTYEWTNNGDDSTSFAAAVNPQVFQNGVQLDVAIYTENPSGYDPSDELKEIKPGTTQQLSLGYVLTDDSDVSVEVSDLVDFSGAKVTHTYQLS